MSAKPRLLMQVGLALLFLVIMLENGNAISATQAGGGVSENVVVVGRSVEVWAFVANTGSSNLSDLNVQLAAAGLDVASRPSWPSELAKNANVTGVYVLKATETGSHTISLLVSYNLHLESGEVAQSTLVAKIADLDVRSPYYPVPEPVTSGLAVLLSSWLIQTVTILGVGSLVADRLKASFNAKEKEKETYVQSLAAVKDLAFGYVVPTAATARNVASYLKEATENYTEPKARLTLYAIADFLSRSLLWLTQAGSVYRLKDYEAERVAVELQRKLYGAFPSCLGMRQMALLAEYASTNDGKPLAFKGYPKYLKDLQNPRTEVSKVYRSFKKWLTTPNNEQAARLMKLMSCWGDYTIYEVNRMFRPWYGEDPAPLSKECTDLIKVECPKPITTGPEPGLLRLLQLSSAR